MRPGTHRAARYTPPVASVDTTSTWWNAGSTSSCVAAWLAKGAASQAASYVNLVTPGTYNAAPGMAPTWNTATGWTFDGTSKYLTTGLTPAATWSIIARCANCTLEFLSALMGCRSASNERFFIASRYNNDSHIYAHGSASVIAGLLTAGVMAMTPTNGYLNGTSETAVGTISGALPSLYLGGENNNGTLQNGLYGDLLAAAVYNAALTGDQVAAISTAMAAL